MFTIRRCLHGNSSTRRKDGCQLLRRDDLKLGVGAVERLLVGAPSPELRYVTEAISLHVVVCDLYDQLGAHRLPGQVLALTPAALTSGHALRSSGFIWLGSVFGPSPPGVSGERIFPIGLKKLRQLQPFLNAETGTDSN